MNALLKLLAGSQAGAELVLAPGEYTLGSADDADLVLSDAAVLPRHAVLRIADSGWRVEPLDGAEVRVDGRLIQGAAPAAAYQVISLGGVHFALGPEGPWSRLPAIPAPAIDTPPPAAAPPETGGEIAAVEKPAPAEGEAARNEDGAAVPAAPERHGARRLVLAGLLAVSLAAAAYLYWRPLTLTRIQAASLALSEHGLKVVSPPPANPEQIPAGRIGVSAAPDGGVVLAGLVRTQAEKLDALAAAGLSGQPAADRLFTADGNIAAAAARLAASYPGLRLTMEDGDFSARLSGLVNQPDEAALAYKLARESVDPRIAIRRALLVWPDLRRELELAAAKLGLPDASFDYYAGRMSLRSAQRPDARQREALLAMAREDYGGETERLLAEALAERSEPSEPPRMTVIASPSLPRPEAAKDDSAPVPDPEAGVAAADSGKKEEAAETPAWLVKSITRNGFIDQNDQEHLNGEYLSPNLRLIKAWDDGVMLQRGRETLLGQAGSLISENK